MSDELVNEFAVDDDQVRRRWRERGKLPTPPTRRAFP
jgi:hypothetical protein